MPTLPIADGQHNIGHICTAQQCARGLGGKTAMRWIDARGARTDYSFADLDSQSNRCANLLTSLGLAPGDVFFTFLPKAPELFFGFLGALKARVVCGTMFPNFGEDALLDRLGDSGAKAILTKRSLLKRILRIRPQLPALRFVIVADGLGGTAEGKQAGRPQPNEQAGRPHHNGDPTEGVFGLQELMEAASPEFAAALTPADTPSVLHYTSGSTGKPKGVLHRHGAIAGQHGTTLEVLGLREDDIYWCTADQGWVTGTSYGIAGPWSLGVTQVHYGGGYDAAAWMRLLAEERITVWYTAPTALRMLMREDAAIFADGAPATLRSIFSVGEPLNPEVVHWGRRVLHRDIHDTWFQTETGAIMIANRPGLAIRPGSMGRPVAGVRPAIVADDGAELPDGERGHLCLAPGWPSMFVTYLNHEDVYREKFRHGWYHTGDTARRDADGYYWFMGRSDDVINTAGHLISPFEVESALLEIPEVAESGVIGAPDDTLFEKVVAFVHLRDGVERSTDLELKIRLHVSNRASSIATPQDIVFCDSIPKNKSGKIVRRVLRARYLGEDPGDISTLETEP